MLRASPFLTPKFTLCDDANSTKRNKIQRGNISKRPVGTRRGLQTGRLCSRVNIMGLGYREQESGQGQVDREKSHRYLHCRRSIGPGLECDGHRGKTIGRRSTGRRIQGAGVSEGKSGPEIQQTNGDDRWRSDGGYARRAWQSQSGSRSGPPLQRRRRYPFEA